MVTYWEVFTGEIIMGEAKRRRKLNPNFGKYKTKVFIQKSYLSNRHAVILGIRDSYDKMPIAIQISAHTKIEDAWYGKTQIERAVKDWKGNLAQIFKDHPRIGEDKVYSIEPNSFFSFINQDEYDYSANSVIYQLTPKGIQAVDIDTLGVTPINKTEPVIAWYVEASTLLTEQELLSDSNFCGDPEEYCIFFVKSVDGDFLTLKENSTKSSALTFSSYITGAVICDYLNSLDTYTCNLSKDVYENLYIKSNLMQGKIKQN